MTLGRQVVDLVRLHVLDHPNDAARVGHVAVVQNEAAIGFVRVLVEMVDAIGVEKGSAALDAMNLVALSQQKLCQIGAVLAGDARNKRNPP